MKRDRYVRLEIRGQTIEGKGHAPEEEVKLEREVQRIASRIQASWNSLTMANSLTMDFADPPRNAYQEVLAEQAIHDGLTASAMYAVAAFPKDEKRNSFKGKVLKEARRDKEWNERWTKVRGWRNNELAHSSKDSPMEGRMELYGEGEILSYHAGYDVSKPLVHLWDLNEVLAGFREAICNVYRRERTALEARDGTREKGLRAGLTNEELWRELAKGMPSLDVRQEQARGRTAEAARKLIALLKEEEIETRPLLGLWIETCGRPGAVLRNVWLDVAHETRKVAGAAASCQGFLELVERPEVAMSEDGAAEPYDATALYERLNAGIGDAVYGRALREMLIIRLEATLATGGYGYGKGKVLGGSSDRPPALGGRHGAKQ